MRLMLSILLLGVAVGLWGCQQEDKRINMVADVKSDNAVVNIVTKPVIYAFSWVIGEGLDIDRAVTYVNKDGFMELEVQGHNRAFNPIRFEYKVEWLDKSGITIDSATSKWLTWSAAAKAPFVIKAVAPRTTAVDFRMNTRKIPN
ncbi:MAG: YcfL family protein [Sedimentisphaerales bacterium]